MRRLEKFYTVFILSAVFIGIIAGQFEFIYENADLFITPLLMAMLYLTFLQIPMNQAKQALRNRKFTYTAVLLNFIWTPLLAWFLAYLFLGSHPALYIGFIMLMVTPCTDWYLIFTNIARGNVALATAILPVNLLLQIILLPVYLLIFAGTTGVIEISTLAESVFLVLLLPLLLAMGTKRFFRAQADFNKNLFANLNGLSIVFLSLAIMAMFASQGHVLLGNVALLGLLLLPILLFFAVNFFISQRVGRLMDFADEDKISLTLTTAARNSPIALAIAVAAFPDQPLIALTLVVGPLLELPVLAVISQILLKQYRSAK